MPEWRGRMRRLSGKWKLLGIVLHENSMCQDRGVITWPTPVLCFMFNARVRCLTHGEGSLGSGFVDFGLGFVEGP